MYPLLHAIEAVLAGSWGTLFENALEWSATLVSLVAFYLCILKKPSSFLIFLWADSSWGLSAVLSGHWALVVQQVLYMGMNVAGYLIWKREEAEELMWETTYRDLQQQVKTLRARLAEFELEADADEITPVPMTIAESTMMTYPAIGPAEPVPAPTASVAAGTGGGVAVAAFNASSAASAASTSCLASVRNAASCSPAR